MPGAAQHKKPQRGCKALGVGPLGHYTHQADMLLSSHPSSISSYRKLPRHPTALLPPPACWVPCAHRKLIYDCTTSSSPTSCDRGHRRPPGLPETVHCTIATQRNQCSPRKPILRHTCPSGLTGRCGQGAGVRQPDRPPGKPKRQSGPPRLLTCRLGLGPVER